MSDHEMLVRIPPDDLPNLKSKIESIDFKAGREPEYVINIKVNKPPEKKKIQAVTFDSGVVKPVIR